ncbi:MAG: tRNA (adenosine(37)-N6)-threonylcarbamoyltransferase complex transferase subunit TsaD [Lentisphaeria bacterium]|nr:tRNA (adenosine(37)-N6)-threonylcarbamoyltransferase complex transferase subunit TsaD [Lentisphaeria bacterium]
MSLILGIESSCDETAVSIVEDGRVVLSNAVASQIAKHAPYGGVIPELAARAHLTAVRPTMDEALKTAGVTLRDVDAVAVTHAPGLIPALLVGLNFAKGLAAANDLPLIPINHFSAHIYGAFLEQESIVFGDPDLFPMLAVVVSGGHTALVVVGRDGRMTLAGTTLDDAAGEAFDKAAKILNLGYPGGPVIERLAKQGDPHAVAFPRSLTPSSGKPVAPENRFHFSFSGVKTALLYHVKNLGGVDAIRDQALFDILASYQEAIVDVLCRKAFDAAKHFNVRSVVLAGGVACNGALRERFEATVPKRYRAVLPLKKYCTDNAAMVAGLGWHYWKRGVTASLELDAQARLPLNQTVPIWFDRPES